MYKITIKGRLQNAVNSVINLNNPQSCTVSQIDRKGREQRRQRKRALKRRAERKHNKCKKKTPKKKTGRDKEPLVKETLTTKKTNKLQKASMENSKQQQRTK